MYDSSLPSSWQEQFSPRERDIIVELMAAHSVKEIAERLELSVNTVKDYLKAVYHKAHVHSARELVIKFHASRPPASETREIPSHILDNAERLLNARYFDQAREWLIEGVRSCTSAGNIQLWNVTRDGTWLILSQPGQERRLSPTSQLLRTAMTEGFGHLLLEDPGFEAELRRLTALQIRGEALGVRLCYQQRFAVLLLSQPHNHRFTHREAITARLFGQLASSAFQRAQRPAMAAQA